MACPVNVRKILQEVAFDVQNQLKDNVDTKTIWESMEKRTRFIRNPPTYLRINWE